MNKVFDDLAFDEFEEIEKDHPSTLDAHAAWCNVNNPCNCEAGDDEYDDTKHAPWCNYRLSCNCGEGDE